MTAYRLMFGIAFATQFQATPNAVTQKTSPNAQTKKERAAKDAIQFLDTLYDDSVDKKSLKFPFVIYLPCKGGEAKDLDEYLEVIAHFQSSWRNIEPTPMLKLKKIGTLREYLRPFELKESDIKQHVESFKQPIVVVYLTFSDTKDGEIAVMLNEKDGLIRGAGVVFPSKE